MNLAMPCDTTRRRAAVLAAIAACALASCSSPDGSSAAFCSQVTSTASALDAGSITDPVSAKRTVDAFVNAESVVPNVISDDWRKLADMFQTVSTVDPTAPNAFGDAIASALDPELTQAARNVTLYVQDTCGIDLNATTTVAGSSPTTAVASSTSVG